MTSAEAPSEAFDGLAHRSLGLTDDEYAAIGEILGRRPTPVELAMFAVMWSEHCSYKSSRVHLGRLPSEAPWVLVGPGENAGVVDAGGGVAVALRIESHNHPSAIEPYQGAATGVGGILRDIFTMGARPIAVLDSLHFGRLGNARSRWLLDGVVSGVSGYGNAVGVPTVGGEIHLDDAYAENPLVNVMCVGLLRSDQVLLGRATGVGNLALLLGSTTGRDGIGGVSVLASAGFGGGDSSPQDGEAVSKRPSVQVGDPYEEKRLIEACLALYDAGLVVGIQDLGGAGLACATSETASRGGVGMDVDVRAVPLREAGMQPSEIMTSESQERMLAIVRPEDLDEAVALCRRWEVRATVVGTVTDTGRLRVLDGPRGDVLADLPASALHDHAPRYHRPLRPPADRGARRADDPASALPPPAEAGSELLALLVDTSWVWSQYDHQLFLNTVEGPGGDAALLRLKAPGLPRSDRALAVTVDSNARWCAVDPRLGTELVVAESVLNLACVGARPVAIVDCLNLGNPEHAEVMWQLSEVVDGLAAACRALDVPVVGGNVSLYNESRGRDIDPTPVIGGLGLVDALVRRPPGVALVEGHQLLLLGEPEGASLAGSAWAAARGHRGGSLPPVDYERHLALAAFVRGLVTDGTLSGVHDVSAGGLGVALAEMAVRSGVGFDVILPRGDHAGLFGEGPSQVVVCVPDPDPVTAGANDARVSVQPLGTAGGDRLRIAGLLDVGVHEAAAAWRGALPRALQPDTI